MSGNNGWIKTYRAMEDNPIICKDSDYYRIWMYLLLHATYKPYDAIFKGERITLKPGQLLTGRMSISKKTKIEQSKIQRILKCFENEHQIEQQTSNKNRLITIVNWNLYQDCEQQNEQQVNNNRTTSEQQVNTNNNYNNYNNYKNINKEPSCRTLKMYDDDSSEMILAKQMLKRIIELNENFKKPNIQKWADTFNKMIRLDKREPKYIWEIIEYVYDDKFWCSNVLSPDKLRKQYDVLYIKYKQKEYREEGGDCMS